MEKTIYTFVTDYLYNHEVFEAIKKILLSENVYFQQMGSEVIAGKIGVEQPADILFEVEELVKKIQKLLPENCSPYKIVFSEFDDEVITFKFDKNELKIITTLVEEEEIINNNIE